MSVLDKSSSSRLSLEEVIINSQRTQANHNITGNSLFSCCGTVFNTVLRFMQAMPIIRYFVKKKKQLKLLNRTCSRNQLVNQVDGFKEVSYLLDLVQ